MPFDMSKQPRKPRKPRKPKIDRDKAALAIQKRLNRPLSWEEYTAIWNALTREMGKTDLIE